MNYLVSLEDASTALPMHSVSEIAQSLSFIYSVDYISGVI